MSRWFDVSILLQLENITKHYGATAALDCVSFDLHAGEVHALMGENGAGKSTLIKILAGNIERDSGRILVDGQVITIKSPHDATRHGIAIIHQELNTVPAMTVAENLALGKEKRTLFGLLDRRHMLAQARQALDLIQAYDIDPRQKLETLSVGQQQMVEIARAVSEQARILVLDEPTAALSRNEAQALYRLINRMRGEGVGMIYISHRMEEIWQLADRITILRDGRHVGTGSIAQWSEAQVVSRMVGREVGALYAHKKRNPARTLVEVKALCGGGISAQHRKIGPIDLQVRAGEVVALTGLIGSGRTELARMIFAADRRLSGTILIEGVEKHHLSPRHAIRDGIGMVPEDRKMQSLFLNHSVQHNIAISALASYATLGFIRRRKIRQAVLMQMQALHLRHSALNLPAHALSGGNQQKLALARWLLCDSHLLILDEPTRGVDIGAKREIYEVIDKLASHGKAILIISSDLPEALGISDRLLVMRHGKIVAEFQSDKTSEEEVMSHATGVV